jgi:hypothetical protein
MSGSVKGIRWLVDLTSVMVWAWSDVEKWAKATGWKVKAEG